MTGSAMRSLPLGHVPQRSGSQVFGDGPHGKVCRVDAPAMKTARPAEALAACSRLVVAEVINLSGGHAENEPVGVDHLSLDAQPAVAVRLDVRRVPRDARAVNHASSVALFGRLDGQAALPDFTEGTGSI